MTRCTIETKELSKRFGDVSAVDGLSLRVARGEIYAFLGLNGAGKSTTIRMLLGMIKPTAGEVHMLGTRIGVGRGNRELWGSIGYLVEKPHAYPELTVRENLEVVRRLRPGVRRDAVRSIIDRLGLTPYAGRRARTLSLGNAQRLGLAKALLHAPELVILDEPANGLDPEGIVEIRNMLRDLADKQGVTIFFSSHILGEVAQLADRIGIIHEGRLLQEVDVDQLKRNRSCSLLVQTRNSEAARAVLREAGFTFDVRSDQTMAIKDEGAIRRPDDVAVRLVRAGHPPTMLRVEQEDLEEYFLRLISTRRGARR